MSQCIRRRPPHRRSGGGAPTTRRRRRRRRFRSSTCAYSSPLGDRRGCFRSSGRYNGRYGGGYNGRYGGRWCDDGGGSGIGPCGGRSNYSSPLGDRLGVHEPRPSLPPTIFVPRRSPKPLASSRRSRSGSARAGGNIAATVALGACVKPAPAPKPLQHHAHYPRGRATSHDPTSSFSDSRYRPSSWGTNAKHEVPMLYHSYHSPAFPRPRPEDDRSRCG